MFATLHRVLPQRRRVIDEYIHHAWTTVIPMIMNLPEAARADALQHRFDDYVTEHEATLRANLEQIHFDVEEADTVRVLINGELEHVSPTCVCHLDLYSGIDYAIKSLLPMLYLLLQHHLELIKLATLNFRSLSATNGFRAAVTSSDLALGLKKALHTAKVSLSSINQEHRLRGRDIRGNIYPTIECAHSPSTSNSSIANFIHQRRDFNHEGKLFAAGLVSRCVSGC